MKDKEALDGRLQTTAWGLLFIWWGISIFFDRIPLSAGLVGTGVILLGLNGVRAARGIQTRGGTTMCGILALAWGALELIRSNVRLPFEMNDWAVFSILLAVFGLILLGSVMPAARSAKGKAPGSEA